MTQAKRRPATSLVSREQQLVSLAVDLAEEQLTKKTASAQVILHYLRLGTSINELEKAKLEQENLLLQAKTASYSSEKDTTNLLREAISAMTLYSGQGRLNQDVQDAD